MNSDRLVHWRGWRRLALAAVAVMGIGSIVGSGGGSTVGCLFCLPPLLQVFISGPEVVQVGEAAVFTTTEASRGLSGPHFYRWCRSASVGAACVQIAGEFGSVFVVEGANLADDGAVFMVTVEADGLSSSAQATLHVSNTPPVRFEDGEFQLSNWAVTAASGLASSPPRHHEERVPAGGNPGAYLSTTYEKQPDGGGSLLFYAARVAVYDPATQGALYALQVSMDSFQEYGKSASLLLIEQGARRFVERRDFGSYDNPDTINWVTRSTDRLAKSSFQKVDGPDCEPPLPCEPDFSASAPPLQFGFAHVLYYLDPREMASGIDNWKLSIWRR